MKPRTNPRPVMFAAWLTLAAACGWAADAPKKADPGVRYVYLIRHGTYDRDDKTDDRVGNGLNALGHEQARLIGERLAQLPVKMTALVSSDFSRARDTADDIGCALGMTPARDSLIHECTPATERIDLMRNHTPDEIARCDSNLQAAWAKYMVPSPAADSHDVLVCHGNVIRWFVSRVLALDTQRWSRMDIGNGSLTVIAIRADGSARLVSFSDVGHLPVEKQTWSGRGVGWTNRNTSPRVPLEHYLLVDGGSLHFETAGAGDAVLFLHGGFGDRRMWDDAFNALSDRYHVVRFDLRGYGKSSSPTAPYSPAEDIVHLLDHLQIARAHVVGNSMGGTLALDFALLHPDRVERLVLVACGPSGFPQSAADHRQFDAELQGMRAVWQEASQKGPDRGVELWLAHPMVAVTSRLPATSGRLRTMVEANRGMFSLEHWPVENLKPAAIERLGEVRAPTLVVVGDRDTPMIQAGAAVVVAGVLGAKLVVIAGGDHLPHMVDPGGFHCALREFLAAGP